MAELSPMMKQYLEMKKQYPDAILFFRLGDFYEMFQAGITANEKKPRKIKFPCAASRITPATVI